MAKKIDTVTEIETPKKPSLFEMIDEEIQHESKVELEAKRALFENDHDTKKLDDVYDEIDQQQINDSVEKEDYEEVERLDALYGSKEEFEKMRERRKRVYRPKKIKNDEKPVITLEINPQKKEKVKNEKIVRARKTLWTVVLSLCLVVVFSLCIFNTVNLVNSANSLNEAENNLQNETETLQENQFTYQQMVDELGSSTTEITEGMVQAGGGTLVNLEPVVEVVNPVAPTSFFDKLCSFFAKIFGR